MGFILAASWTKGGTVPAESHKSEEPQQDQTDWNPLENEDGFRPLPTDGNVSLSTNGSAFNVTHTNNSAITISV